MIAEVSRQIPPQPSARFPHALSYRREGIKLASGPLGSHEQLVRSHACWLEDHIFLAIVLLPIVGQDSPLAFEAFEEGSVGKRNEDAHGRRVDGDGSKGVDRAFEDTAVVVVKTKHGANLDGNSEVVKTAHGFGVSFGAVVTFIGTVKTLLRDAFEAQEERFAAALCGKAQ